MSTSPNIVNLNGLDINRQYPISNEITKTGILNSIDMNRFTKTFASDLPPSGVASAQAADVPTRTLTGTIPAKTNPWTQVGSAGLSALGNWGASYLANSFDTEGGLAIGNLFGTGLNAMLSTMGNNMMTGNNIMQGVGANVGSSLASAGMGLAGYYAGKGITEAMGDTKLARGVGAGTASAIGLFGGTLFGNLAAGKGFNLLGANPWLMAANVAGAGLSAYNGSSKEYAGKYGKITKGMDIGYDAVQTVASVIPGWGQIMAAAMAGNNGLLNMFGSTSGMTKTDAILGSKFMPFFIKWANMANAKTTDSFANQSWLNEELTNNFMQNGFGDLADVFDKARVEANKTYGTFSNKLFNKALQNMMYANLSWNDVLNMSKQNRWQNIRSLDMTSINNQRYAQNIQGGFNPIYRGKQGMKILNNATNHNIGMRLLSAAALIDNKQMILSAQSGIKVPVIQNDNTRILKPIIVEPIERKLLPGQQLFNNHGNLIVIDPRREYVQQDNRDSKTKEENHNRAVQVRKQELMKKAEEKTALFAGAVLERAMPSYWVERATGENLGTVGRLAVDLTSPFVLGKGVLLLGKTGQILTKVPNIIRNRGFAVVENTPWNTTKIKWKGLGNNSYIELENNGEWLKPKMMESTYHGTGRKLYDAAIGYALNNGYRGIMSGENLLSAPKTYNIWRHYPNKILLLGTGSHSNAKMTSGIPFYKEVSTEKELLDATKNNVKAYREGPIMGLTEPSLRIYLRNEAGLLVKVPIQKTTNVEKITLENAINITPEQWTTAQDAAIARGDMAEAQRLRDLHFKVQFPDNVIVTKEGEPIRLYHGTNHDRFNVFDRNKFGEHDNGSEGFGFYFSPNKNIAQASAISEPSEYYVYSRGLFNSSTGAPGEAEMIGTLTAQEAKEHVAKSMDDLINSEYYKQAYKNINNDRHAALNSKYDSKSFDADNLENAYEIVATKPNQIKLADAVTYDNNGVRIPLGERDNFNIKDIRYGLLPFVGVTGAATLHNKSK